MAQAGGVRGHFGGLRQGHTAKGTKRVRLENRKAWVYGVLIFWALPAWWCVCVRARAGKWCVSQKPASSVNRKEGEARARHAFVGAMGV